MSPLIKGCIAEYIGTFALVFFGAGSILLTAESAGSAGSLVTVALAHGLTLAVFITGSMYISGGQLNPAVSIGLMAIGKQSPKRTAAFVGSQLAAGACAAGMLVFVFTPEVANTWNDATKTGTNVGATMGRFTHEGNIAGVLILETLQTFALMFVILTTAVDARSHKLGGFCIGLTVTVCILAFGPITGSSMNPARTFGPALYGHWDMHWAYWIGPITGAILAAGVYKFVWEDDKAAR